MTRTNRQAKRWLRTSDKRWLAIRDQVLQEEPFCRVCKALSTHCDHINGRSEQAQDYDRSNLQGLCASCHSEKTAQEQAGKEWKPKGCDVNGTPFAVEHERNVPRLHRSPNEGAGQRGS